MASPSPSLLVVNLRHTYWQGMAYSASKAAITNFLLRCLRDPHSAVHPGSIVTQLVHQDFSWSDLLQLVESLKLCQPLSHFSTAITSELGRILVMIGLFAWLTMLANTLESTNTGVTPPSAKADLVGSWGQSEHWPLHSSLSCYSSQHWDVEINTVPHQQSNAHSTLFNTIRFILLIDKQGPGLGNATACLILIPSIFQTIYCSKIVLKCKTHFSFEFKVKFDWSSTSDVTTTYHILNVFFLFKVYVR